MKIYIAGPMTGYPELNFPAFDKARDRLIKQGCWVVSPVDLERNRTPRSYEEMLRDDLKYLLTCDAIYLLKGWKKSKGAQFEWCVATTIGLQIFYEE